MARIRYIKPGFFKDEDLAEHPHWVRLLFAGLWPIADKEGRLEDRPKRIKIEVFPYEDINVDDGLDILSRPKSGDREPFIRRYEVDGQKFIEILNWSKHQRPHHTETGSIIPKFKPGMKLKEKTVKEPLVDGEKREGMGMGMGKGMGRKDPASPESLNQPPEEQEPNPKSVDLKDINIKGLSEPSKHRLYNDLIVVFAARGWRVDAEFLKPIFLDVAKGMENYNPREMFPYFKKALQKWINFNAEYLSNENKKQYQEHEARR